MWYDMERQLVCFLTNVLQNLSELALHKISLAVDPQHARNEEEKISSSSLRYRLLGTLLYVPQVSNICFSS